jgi:hypothetical protein
MSGIDLQDIDKEINDLQKKLDEATAKREKVDGELNQLTDAEYMATNLHRMFCHHSHTNGANGCIWFIEGKYNFGAMTHRMWLASAEKLLKTMNDRKA